MEQELTGEWMYVTAPGRGLVRALVLDQPAGWRDTETGAIRSGDGQWMTVAAPQLGIRYAYIPDDQSGTKEEIRRQMMAPYLAIERERAENWEGSIAASEGRRPAPSGLAAAPDLDSSIDELVRKYGVPK